MAKLKLNSVCFSNRTNFHQRGDSWMIYLKSINYQLKNESKLTISETRKSSQQATYFFQINIMKITVTDIEKVIANFANLLSYIRLGTSTHKLKISTCNLYFYQIVTAFFVLFFVQCCYLNCRVIHNSCAIWNKPRVSCSRGMRSWSGKIWSWKIYYDKLWRKIYSL